MDWLELDQTQKSIRKTRISTTKEEANMINLLKYKRLIVVVSIMVVVSKCSASNNGKNAINIDSTGALDARQRDEAINLSRSPTKTFIDGEKLMRGEVVRPVDDIRQYIENKERYGPSQNSDPSVGLMFADSAFVKIEKPYETAKILEKLFKEIVWQGVTNRFM